jgi:hypothetical protein
MDKTVELLKNELTQQIVMSRMEQGGVNGQGQQAMAGMGNAGPIGAGRMEGFGGLGQGQDINVPGNAGVTTM